jgi:hypothetical protein
VSSRNFDNHIGVGLYQQPDRRWPARTLHLQRFGQAAVLEHFCHDPQMCPQLAAAGLSRESKIGAPPAPARPRQFSISIAFRVGDLPIALKAEPIENY